MNTFIKTINPKITNLKSAGVSKKDVEILKELEKTSNKN